MKLSVMIATFVICSSSFAATIANGIELKGLPTASKSYKKFLGHFEDRHGAELAMREECLKDKASAEAFITKSDSKILKSSGCEVSLNSGYADQGGYQPDSLSTNFEVIFK